MASSAGVMIHKEKNLGLGLTFSGQTNKGEFSATAKPAKKGNQVTTNVNHSLNRAAPEEIGIAFPGTGWPLL